MLRSFFGAALLITLIALPLWAQTEETPATAPPAPAATATEVEGGIEEIVVTITKRDESIQEVGGTIAAFGEEMIQNANIESVGDLIGLLPNVQVKSDDTDVSIRGVARAAFDSQSPVAMHVNGVYFANSMAYIGQFYDLEDVQVALGPSGSLYGRNANGGAIDVRWRKPHSDWEVSGDTTWAPEYDNWQIRSAVNIPLSGVGSDLLNARIAFIREVQDGTLSNSEDTERNSFNAKDDWSTRLFLRSEPTENVALELHGRYFKGDRRYAGGVSLLPAGQRPVGVLGPIENPFVPGEFRNMHFDWASGFAQFKNDFLSMLGFPSTCSTTPPPICFPDAAIEGILLGANLIRDPIFFTPLPSSRFNGGQRSVHSRLFQLGSGDLEMWDVDGSLEWNLSGLPLFGDVDFIFSGGYGRIDNEGLSDSDATEYEALDTISSQKPETRSTFEFRFQSNNEGWLNWALGFFYVKNRIVQDRDTLTPLTISGASLTQREVGYAPFANVTLTPIDPLEIFLGVRWNHDEFFRHEISNPTPLTSATDFRGGDTWRETTLDAGIKWFVTDDRRHMLYAKWARGYKAGFIQLLSDPNGAATPGDPSDDFIINSVAPESILATEIGAKTSWFDRRLNLNLSAFHYDYTKMQVPVIKVIQIVNINADKATVWGAELSIDSTPIEDLYLRFSLGWLQAEFDDFCADEPLAPVYGINPVLPVDPGCVGDSNGGLDLSGNRMEDSPEWKTSVLASYRWDLGANGVVTPTLEFTWTDDAFRRPQNNPLVDRLDSYTKTDLRVRWETEGNRYWVEAFGENLENEIVYPRGIVVALTGTAQGFGLLQPRTYGVRLGFNWGSGN